ncbi:cleavage stimulation factor subunit 3-like [Oncorhynchus nerka]|uniref:cleavage stimulation factor subunit 3-like n=1 Tax=Oncorhynchus nerka TaxID=8023 RepID=UPI0031B88CF9
MDLYPCSASELKALGYKDVSRAKLAALLQTETVVTPSAPTQKDEADRKPEYPKPDTSQMIPYQPRHMAPPGLHPVPGGVFPVPPAAVILMKLLPPPTCFVVSTNTPQLTVGDITVPTPLHSLLVTSQYQHPTTHCW